MELRWRVLLLLFVVRLTMSFQFQSVAAVSPALIAAYGVGLADIGFFISLYLAPGLFFALPGGAIGQRFGDKRVILAGLVLMIGGGIATTYAHTWQMIIFGRAIAGVGGVLLNVLMSKVVTDCFAGKELATAMAIFVNSWPVGIALCLFVLPGLAAAKGIPFAFGIATALCVFGFALLAGVYKAPKTTDEAKPSVRSSWPRRPVALAVVTAGCIWGFFNAAIGMVFAFGTQFLVQRGWSLASAGSATSIALWMISGSVPVGGFIADRTGKPAAVMLSGFVLFSIALFVTPRTDAVIAALVTIGIVGGLSAGPIMSLPARVLAHSERAIGIGLYFTMFNLMVVAAPIVAGVLSTSRGSASAAFDLGAAMLLMCLPAYWLFEQLAVKIASSREVVAG